MACYQLAGQVFHFIYPVLELEPFRLVGIEPSTPQPLLTVPAPVALVSRTVGWVGGEQREVESWSAPPGILLKVAGGGDFYITPGGRSVVKVERGGNVPPSPLSELDREILLGPALVLALALRGTWCLHASVMIFKNQLIVFLGESGQGKSTLAAYLTATGRPDWRLVADDILPVTVGSAGADAWPHFPQLKLPMKAQPGPGLPEHLPLGWICVLTLAARGRRPELLPLPPSYAAQMLVRHTAGARLFDPELLAEHLAFCARVAERIPAYQLIYPHRKDTLPKVREFLENSC